RIFFIRFREIKASQKEYITRRVSQEIKEKIFKAYSEAKSSLLLIDYDGTIVTIQKEASEAIPTSEVFTLLKNLKQNNSAQVVIVSGRSHQELDKCFKEKTDLLIAEHGIWSTHPDGRWKSKVEPNPTWKIPVRRILSRYVYLTPGAHIEEKSHSLVWHYRGAEIGHAQLRIGELKEKLRYLLVQYDLELLEGNKVIEVKPQDINKGSASMEVV